MSNITVNPTKHSLLAAIAIIGGWDRDDARAEGIDPAHFLEKYTIHWIFRINDGKSLCHLKEILTQLNYLGPTSNLLELIHKELHGYKQYSTEVNYEYVFCN